MRLFLALIVSLLPLSAAATPVPDLNLWLAQHPRVANAIAWTFPDTLSSPPSNAPITGGRMSTRGTWMRQVAPKMGIWSKIDATVRMSATSSTVQGIPSSCPVVQDSPSPGKSLIWCQWPQAYRDKLKNYYASYWSWMEASWALYGPYKDGGFAQKPAGFDERFGSTIDPETGAEPGTLPYAEQYDDDGFTYVVFDSDAATNRFLKTVALQLVLETAPYLNWSLDDYDDGDLTLLLNGGNPFEYMPVGGRPYSEWITDHEGYKVAMVVPAPPLVLMKFLLREGILRHSRFETVSRFLEWERGMSHLNNWTSDTGGCDDELNEVIWGFKGPPPLNAILHGTVVTCRNPPGGYDGTVGYNETVRKHYTHGCPTTGDVSYQVMRLVNVPAENFRRETTHSQARFVVERAPMEAMVSELEPLLPFEPPLEPGQTSSHFMQIPWGLLPSDLQSVTASRANSFLPPTTRRGSDLANAYISHNDDPYGMAAEPEIPVREVLLDETTFRRWFPPVPTGLTAEEKMDFRKLHDRRLGLRQTQLEIARLPMHLFEYFCWKQDAGKPHAQTETYRQFFERHYTPAQLDQTGFWARFDQKFNQLGGCEGLAPSD
ncbi:MAG TPA: hypothetical protein VFX30_09160 [bacterium]|nr:hypothetical protein [bacterium]